MFGCECDIYYFEIARPISSSQASGLCTAVQSFQFMMMYVAVLFQILKQVVLVHVLSDRRGGSSASNNIRKDEYNWRYDADDISEEVLRASAALESVQLDRKSRNLPTSWR